MAKESVLHIRCTPELKAAFEKAAAADNRSLTNWTITVLTEELKKKGFM